MESIVSIVFEEESKGYQAITELRHEPVGEGLVVSQAVLAKKEFGMVRVLDSFDTGIDTQDDTVTGGLIGSLIGILGGPLGVLLGGSIGSLVGTALDLSDAEKNSSMIEKVMEVFNDGEVALVVLVQEEVEGALNRVIAMEGLDVVKMDAAEVEAEIQEAEKIQQEMAKEARKRLHEEKKQENIKMIEERREKIKEGFDNIKEKFNKNA